MDYLQSGNDKEIFINREISWLHFNGRVLQEANDKTTPLIERMKFLGIYSNNRDEFFRVRVATIGRLIKLEHQSGLTGTRNEEILEEINKMVNHQERQFRAYYKKLVRELARYKIFLIDETMISESQKPFIKNFFQEKVRANTFPLILDNVRSLTSIPDASLFLAVHLKDSRDPNREEYALTRIPSDITGRFVILPDEEDKKYIILIDDIIRYCLKDIFAFFGFDTFQAYTIKFTRDAELDIDNDVSKSFLELIGESIKKRKRGEPVRFVYESKLPARFLKKLLKKFGVTKNDTLNPGGRYHNFKDFIDFPRIGPPELFYYPTPPVAHPAFRENQSIFALLRKKDVMVHWPYQTFQHFIDLLREASMDKKVRSIKMTFYRVGKVSAAMNALINAARNGKYVTVFMELQARFDEEANIFWTQRLQEEGVKVIPTIPSYKVHAKLLLIRRREENNENHYYSVISTGNFNEVTAKVYADDSLWTANQEICADVYNIFELLEARFILPSFSVLKVAPFAIRDLFIDMLENELKNYKSGKEAWAILKMNSLVDKKAARKLYEVTEAGVKVDLIARGMCVIKPGVEGLSSNINAFSIVDKFLEHSRVYVFCNGGDNLYFIGSADWMQRNFDHRIEVITPVLDKDIQKELMDMLQIQLRDNTKARYLGPDNMNEYKSNGTRGEHRAQFEIYEYFKAKAGE